jgi:DNA-binding SARP family transcriptional activator
VSNTRGVLDAAIPLPRVDADTSMTLQLLGAWRLVGAPAASALIGENSRKLLAMLGLRGPLSRQQIAGTIWPEIGDEAASARLRTLLWRVRPAGALLDEHDGALRLGASVQVDVDTMRAAARMVEILDPPGVSVAVFAADLLPGWYDDWLVIDRERIRQARLHALETLSARRTSQGRYAEALDAALLAVGAEPLRETAHRAVISAHLAEGNTAEAIRQFEACRALLASELGVQPTAALAALVAR